MFQTDRPTMWKQYTISPIRTPKNTVCRGYKKRNHSFKSQLQKMMTWVQEVRQDFVFLIVLGYNDTSTLVCHFVLSPREREKRDRRGSIRNEKEGQGRKRNRKESKEPEKNYSPLYPYLLQWYQALPTVSQYQLDTLVQDFLCPFWCYLPFHFCIEKWFLNEI